MSEGKNPTLDIEIKKETSSNDPIRRGEKRIANEHICFLITFFFCLCANDFCSYFAPAICFLFCSSFFSFCSQQSFKTFKIYCFCDVVPYFYVRILVFFSGDFLPFHYTLWTWETFFCDYLKLNGKADMKMYTLLLVPPCKKLWATKKKKKGEQKKYQTKNK